MKVWLSSHLRHYTANKTEVTASGTTLAEALADLDRQYPGLTFRIIDEQGKIRPHINVYVNAEKVMKLEIPMKPTDEIHLIGALSGG
ncbi:MAG: MoaD/ThiS family protein [bacterium]